LCLSLLLLLLLLCLTSLERSDQMRTVPLRAPPTKYVSLGANRTHVMQSRPALGKSGKRPTERSLLGGCGLLLYTTTWPLSPATAKTLLLREKSKEYTDVPSKILISLVGSPDCHTLTNSPQPAARQSDVGHTAAGLAIVLLLVAAEYPASLPVLLRQPKH
jgi:hypothetical protein